MCNDGAGRCTLRAAIQQANSAAGADTINVSITGVINLTGALPDLSTDITISGPGANLLTVRRDPDSAPDADFAGYNFWLGKLNEFGGDFVRAEMVKAFLDSTEYKNRFGQ